MHIKYTYIHMHDKYLDVCKYIYIYIYFYVSICRQVYLSV